MSRACAVLLDLDGTVVDLGAPVEDLEQLRSELKALAHRLSVSIDRDGIFAMYRALHSTGVGIDEARRLIDRYEVQWARSTARPLVDERTLCAAAQHCHIGLVTSNGRACVETLRDRGLLPRFAVEATRDDGTRLKPSAEPVNHAVARLGDLPAGVVYLGDSTADRKAVDAYNHDHPTATIRFLPVRDGTGSPLASRSAQDVLSALLRAETA